MTQKKKTHSKCETHRFQINLTNRWIVISHFKISHANLLHVEFKFVQHKFTHNILCVDILLWAKLSSLQAFSHRVKILLNVWDEKFKPFSKWNDEQCYTNLMLTSIISKLSFQMNLSSFNASNRAYTFNSNPSKMEWIRRRIDVFNLILLKM